MSRDSSVSSGSRIGQFGLYRTIDARTEEFLRLSRKRQIRQGCACAAASTAITVTVVIVVFFIYEFSLNSDMTLETSLKSNWLDMMNSTKEESTFDPKFTKANIDRTTLKLLPLLIKAIKKNAYLEKLLEDHANSSPSYEEEDTTEDAFEQNTYSKNWFKMPTTKLYAIEYKTSPVVFYRNPTEKIEYYTKIRKIRDYQRVFNYVDKMISEKVYIRSTKPMLKGEIHTDIPPFHKKMPIKKTTHRSMTTSQTISQSQTSSRSTLDKNVSTKSFSCKCPKKFSEMLHKILAGIQKLLPENNLKETTPYTDNTMEQTTQSLHISALNAKSNFYSTFSDLLVKTQTHTTTESTLNIKSTYQQKITFNFESDHAKETNTYNIDDIFIPLVTKFVEPSTTIVSNVTEKSLSENITQITQPVQFINKYKNIIHRKQLLRNNIPKTTKAKYEPIFDGIEYDDYYVATPNSILTTMNDNQIDFIETKTNYLNDIKPKIKPAENNFKKDIFKKFTTIIQQAPKKSIDKDIKVVDNKVILVKAKPLHANELIPPKEPNNNLTFSYLNKFINFLRPTIPANVTDKKQIIGFISQKFANAAKLTDAAKFSYEIKDKINPSEKNITYKNLNIVSPEVLFVNSTDNKTLYRVINNNAHYLNKNIQKTQKPIQSIDNITSTTVKTHKKSNTNNLHGNDKTNITVYYRTEKKKVPSLKVQAIKPRVTLAVLENHIKTTERNILTSQETSLRTEILRSSTIEDDVDFTTGEMVEITKQPEPTIYGKDLNNVTKIEDYNLTWEDLNSENTPKLKSMIPKPKPLYLEIHRSDIMHEEPQNDDYNMNNNVILLIYEYAIAVEWSLVQINRGENVTNHTNDSPFADKLDRSYFGFDQDYFERMPLLVNALQESNYIDPLLEMSRPLSQKRKNNKTITTASPNLTTALFKQSKIRRTSPRPFIFEYRSPTPLPFSKTYGSRTWVDRYRNAQRLQNIRHVIKYLEKTINAKMGDVYTKPSSSHTSIAFSGVYVEPMVDKLQDNGNQSQTSDMQQDSSDKIESFHSNHQSDPLFNFKPNNPGDVNLLADTLWRFSPLPFPNNKNDKISNVPMFKKIPQYKKYCTGVKCNEHTDETDIKVVELLQSSTEKSTEIPSTKPKSFSVMLNLFPYQPSSGFRKQDLSTHSPVEKIYLTTSKPVRFQFRRKTSSPVRRTYYRYKKPKYLIQKKNEMAKNVKNNGHETTTSSPVLGNATKMVVHVNIYSPEDKTDMRKKTDIATEPTITTTHHSTYTPITDKYFELSSGQVEDFHDGSSGVIPVPEIAEPTPVLPHMTTMIPFFETDTASTDISTWATNAPEVIKFSHEDAKVPEHYMTSMIDTTTEVLPTEINRRTSTVSIEGEQETLIIRLKNDVTTTTEETTTAEDVEETTSERTYVPQTNGHYRSYRPRNPFLSPERNRKKRIQASITGFRTYVPMYVEIKRNKTSSHEVDEK